ncbi:hypothetical protein [Bifidobacterium leontopitheci]|uniref:Uncharacterized protein n=1 Tax=Bifidobacterium leontopitheci TaxID=2650774 RepID=A0A6I1GPD2_9BIFI|nr:hypothetical protein [Bifidobacterium leontopitheci]KAB7789928.1 hypothetical protein F7D09_1541 [Bifidobacterium leontopitheci]
MSDVSYHVDLDFDRFKNIYLAQNARYMRKTGIGAAVVGALMTAGGVAMTISSASDKESWYVLVTGVALLAFGIAMTVHPFTSFGSRKGEVYQFFALFGAPVTGREPLASLRVGFDVSVQDYGVEFRLADGTTPRMPWVALLAKPIAVGFGTVFAGDDGKNSSLLYNMLGVNAYLREGLEALPLIVTAQAEQSYPGLTAEVSRRIADAQTKFGANGNAKGGPEAQAIIAWMDATNSKLTN